MHKLGMVTASKLMAASKVLVTGNEVPLQLSGGGHRQVLCWRASHWLYNGCSVLPGLLLLPCRSVVAAQSVPQYNVHTVKVTQTLFVSQTIQQT